MQEDLEDILGNQLNFGAHETAVSIFFKHSDK